MMVKMFLGVMGTILFLGLISSACSGGSSDYHYKRLNDATVQEYNDFMKWDAKQQAKKYEQSKAFK